MSTTAHGKQPSTQVRKFGGKSKGINNTNKSTTQNNKQETDDSIPSFECSDSEENSSDMSDNEQEETVTPALHGNKAANLHRILQKHKSPLKQTPTTRKSQEQKTPTGNHIPKSIKDLQKSLTPEFKAMARKASSPETDNSAYRNRKVNIDERRSFDDADGDGQVVEEDEGRKEQPPPDLESEIEQEKDADELPMKVQTRRSTRRSMPELKIQGTVKDAPNKTTGEYDLLSLEMQKSSRN